MFTFLSILAILVSILLVLAIIVQNSKGGGLNNAFGASSISNMIGSRKASQDIEKITWYLGAALMVVAFVATVSMTRVQGTATSKMKAAVEKLQRAPSVAPTTPTQESPNP